MKVVQEGDSCPPVPAAGQAVPGKIMAYGIVYRMAYGMAYEMAYGIAYRMAYGIAYRMAYGMAYNKQ